MYPEFPENWGNGGSYTAVQPDGAPRPSDVQLSSDVAWGSQWGVGGQDLSPLPDSTFLTEAMTRVQSHRVRLMQSDGSTGSLLVDPIVTKGDQTGDTHEAHEIR